MAHASLSPSGWDRWATCPGSVSACEGLPDSTSSYADEGTAAHWVLEQCLLERYSGFGDPNTPASNYLGRSVNTADDGQEARHVVVNQEMVEHVQSVLDYVAARKAALEGASTSPVIVLPETRVNPSWALGTDACKGTADVALISDQEIEIIDLKYGRGVVVEVGTQEEPNGQFMLYLLGVLANYRLKVGQVARITVAQPRAGHRAGPIRSLTIGEPEISTFIRQAKTAIAAATVGTCAPRVASAKGCKFCRASSTCKTYAVFAGAAIGAPTAFEHASFMDDLRAFASRDPSQDLTPAELVKILEGADLMRGFLHTIEEHAHNLLVNGAAPPDLQAAFKLVQGRSTRTWLGENEDSTIAALLKIRWKDPVTEKTTGLKKTAVLVEKLRSPSQVETILKSAAKGATLTDTHWEAFKRLVVKPEGKLQMVHVTDPRPAVRTKDPEAMFPDYGAMFAAL
jgi:hypothetical protein